ncbi:MAG TPA: hypothetical protein VM901_08390 [Bdellovibrionota bacterium]|nr:hypothetical protein [Bdellovibrionota bacterium]
MNKLTLILLSFAVSVPALAWNQDVYDSIRERVVMETTRVTVRKEVVINGKTLHFAHEKGFNEYAELLASKIASKPNAAEVEARLWTAYESMVNHLFKADTFTAFLLAQRVCHSPELFEAFLANLNDMRFDRQTRKMVRPANFRLAYNDALNAVSAPKDAKMLASESANTAPHSAAK